MSSFAEVEDARRARAANALPKSPAQFPRELGRAENQTAPGGRERRKHSRHPSAAIVEIIRESDSRRICLPVEVVDVSTSGIGLLTVEPFAPDDRVKVRIRNDIRKFFKETHGIVRWAQIAPEGDFRVGIELGARFSAIDMQLLKQLAAGGDSGDKIWV